MNFRLTLLLLISINLISFANATVNASVSIEEAEMAQVNKLALAWKLNNNKTYKLNTGVDIGNGGDAVVCKNQTGEIISVEQFDFYEARNIRNINHQLGDISVSPLDKVLLVINKLARLDPVLADKFKITALNFFNQTQFLTDSELTDINDSGGLFIPKGCKLEQIAIARQPQFDDDSKIFFINKDLYDKMDNNNKAGLILHEIVYQEFIKKGENNSIKARYFNSKLTSNYLDNITLFEYFKFTDRLGVIPITDIISDITTFLPEPGDTIEFEEFAPRENDNANRPLFRTGENGECGFAKKILSYQVADRLTDKFWILASVYYADLLKGDAKKCSLYTSLPATISEYFELTTSLSSSWGGRSLYPNLNRIISNYQLINFKKTINDLIKGIKTADGGVIATDIERVKKEIKGSNGKVITLYKVSVNRQIPSSLPALPFFANDNITPIWFSPIFFHTNDYSSSSFSNIKFFGKRSVPTDAFYLPEARYDCGANYKNLTDMFSMEFSGTYTTQILFIDNSIAFRLPSINYSTRNLNFGCDMLLEKKAEYIFPGSTTPCLYSAISIYSINQQERDEFGDTFIGESKNVMLTSSSEINSTQCIEWLKHFKESYFHPARSPHKLIIHKNKNFSNNDQLIINNILYRKKLK
ncbi:MAG: hypothetical protein HQK51_16350 [Oligoflexia bacterium]|nr:hypothetical protein [Oligoflexia bacterium]